MSQLLRIKYEGYHADNHVVGIKDLGESLLGFDRILSEGLILVQEGRLARRSERPPFSIVTKAPAAGSYEIDVLLTNAPIVLPLAREAIIAGIGDVMWNIASAAIHFASGSRSVANANIKHVVELTKEANRNQESMASLNNDLVLGMLDRLVPHAQKAVAPIGPSCNHINLQQVAEDNSVDENKSTIIDMSLAEAVRDEDDVEVGDLARYRVKVDGLIHHNRTLKIENPNVAGRFMTANVADPSFENDENPYISAVSNKGYLDVVAKPVLKDGVLHKMTIIEASSSNDDT